MLIVLLWDPGRRNRLPIFGVRRVKHHCVLKNALISIKETHQGKPLIQIEII